MSDLQCIYDISMISEDSQKDFLNGKALEVLLLLLSETRTVKEISQKLSMPSFTVQLYIKRLIDANLIKVSSVVVLEGKVERKYELVSNDIDVLNRLQTEYKEGEIDQVDLSAEHFSNITRNVVKSVKENAGYPNKIKAYFIRTKEEDMKAFRDELNELFDKYQSMEDLEGDMTYGFVSVLAPYELGGKKEG